MKLVSGETMWKSIIKVMLCELAFSRVCVCVGHSLGLVCESQLYEAGFRGGYAIWANPSIALTVGS